MVLIGGEDDPGVQFLQLPATPNPCGRPTATTAARGIVAMAAQSLRLAAIDL